MFGIKSRKSTAKAVASDTYSRYFDGQAGAESAPHQVAFMRTSLDLMSTRSIHGTRSEAESAARALLARFPEGIATVSLAR